ncbi:MAG TPA: O-antigen ligase family protein [Actinomycetota bacterium]
MTAQAALGRLRVPVGTDSRSSRFLWLIAIGAFVVGTAAWASGTLQGGVIALWAFSASAAALAIALPTPYALVSPLFMGVAGWLVDMLPFVILVGWGAVAARWAMELLRERRWPRCGRWIWLPIGLIVWTSLGVLVISSLDFKHFLLLLGIQVLASGVLLACVDALEPFDDRVRAASALVTFIVFLSGAVLLQWVGVNIQALQNGEVRKRVEAAYGVDAFPNNVGMIKYARSIKAGALELRREIDAVAADEPGLPAYEVFQPKFQAYENRLVVRFEGSARAFEDRLSAAGIGLEFDNIGLAPANTVPRMRSFPRNALTYAGVCAAVFPLALFLWWGTDGRRRRLGQAGVAACLFGVGFSLARGAWVAVGLGVVYLLIDGVLSRRDKLTAVGVYVAAALVLTGVFLVKYQVDPLSGRAGGGASVSTRSDLYRGTLDALKSPKRLLLGFGVERSRTTSGTVKEGSRYVPRAGTHSTYLNYLFRTGLPGALAILMIYAIAFLHMRAGARRRSGPEGLFATLVAAAVMIVAAHGVILSLYVEPIYTLTVTLLLGIATAGVAGLGAPLLPRRGRAAASG